MKSICAWCKVVLNGEAQEDTHPVTHGICLRCAQQLLSDLSKPLQEYLDRLGVPVLVLDNGPVVRTANSQARELLGKELPEIEGRRGGDVIECVHASRPGGCGQQADCQGCTIRRLVLETHATGKSFTRVAAYPERKTSEGVKSSRIEISTEKIGDVVLLRFHDIQEISHSDAAESASSSDG